MNKQDAIEMLKSMLPEKISYAELIGASSCYGDGGLVYADPEPYAIETAISALEKQIPKKVTEVKCIHEDWEYCNDCEITLDCALGNVCPTCNNSLDYDCGEKDNYCPECGQKLDWSVEE